MLSPAATLVLIAPLVVALGNLSSREIARLKCRNPLQAEPIYMLDGRASNDAEVQGIAKETIAVVLVSCLNPADSTQLASSVNTGGIPAVIMWTKAGPVSRLKPALQQLVDAQNAKFDKSKKFASRIEELKLQLPDDVKLLMTATKSGWSAVATINRPLSPRCVAFDGDAPTPREMGRVPAMPYCSDF